MKKSIIITILILLLTDTILACSCLTDLGVSFSKAYSVFSGKAVVLAQRDGEYPIVVWFKVSNVWKGPKKKTLSIAVGTAPTCGNIVFEKDKNYVVFANTADFYVETSCAPSFEMTNSVDQQRQIKKLNSFWFRTWAHFRLF